jgi:DNA repair protein RadD
MNAVVRLEPPTTPRRDQLEASTSGIALRRYQEDAIGWLRHSYRTGHRAPLLCLPTAAGKTIIFVSVALGASRKGLRTLVTVHRRELLRQAAAKLEWAGVPFGIIAAGFEPHPEFQTQVGSIQTLTRRLDTIGNFDLIIIDEAHHARAETWGRLFEAQPQAKLLGVTATPARLDEKGLGIVDGGPFDDLIVGAQSAELIADGYLAPARCFVPKQRIDLHDVRVRAGDYVAEELAAVVDHAKITGDAVEQYRKLADHLPAIVFCITVAHAEHVAEAFREAGYRAACVHGGTPTAERDALIAGLGDGSVEVLTNCALIDEGLDVPSVGAVILLRPTQSLVLHRQQIGRGMRPAPGKDALVVLDHVGNSLVHGLAETEVAWSLAGVEKESAEAPVWACPTCDCVNPLATRVCTGCGYEKPAPPPAKVLVAPGELAELTAERLAAIRAMSYAQVVGEMRSEAELRAYAISRGYHSGWVRHRLREQREAAA